MKRYVLPFLLLVSLLLTACEDRYSGWLVLDGVQELDGGETLDGELLLFDGAVIVPAGARVTGSVYMLGGDLQLDGAVEGDVSLVDGRLSFGPEASVGGSVNRAGGQVLGAGQAQIAGGLREGAGLEIPLELTRTRRSAGDILLQSLIGGFLLGLAAAGVVRLMPVALNRVAHAATRHALVSGSLGLLVAVVGPALVVMMAFTVILVPLALLALFIAGLIILYGWIALGVTLGNWLAPRLPRRPGPSLSAFLGVWLFMLLLGLVELIPVAGSVLSLLVAIIALGAVLLTRFGARTFVPALESSTLEPPLHENIP